MSLLVYAVAGRRGGRLALSGIRGERLQTLPVGTFDVIAGVVGVPPRPTERNLRRYDRVIQSIWRRRSAVLPARFGTVLRDGAELELAVRARQQALRRHLAAVRNRAQMTVRIVRGAAGRGPGTGELDVRPRTGTAHLRARARALRLDDVPEVGTLRRAVRRWVRAERVETRGAIATIYHLVPRGAARRYRQLAERTAASAGMRLHVSGPWPPYAFADSW